MRNLSQKTLYRTFTLAIISSIAAALMIESGLVTASSVKPDLRQKEFSASTKAAKTGNITVHAAGRAVTGFHLLDGVSLQSVYAGNANAIDALHLGQVQPLSLSSEDFNHDGAPDMIVGYAAGRRGVIALYKGNIDAFVPTRTDVYQAIQAGRIPSSFDPTVQVFDLPASPDFMVIGDFNRDGRKDILAAARGGGIYLMPGDDQGGFGAAQPITVPGMITALAAGQFNKVHEFMDVAVGIVDEGGPAVLVFDGASDGLLGQPSRYPLSAEATSFAFDSLDNDSYLDLAVAAGSEVVILHGQDRVPGKPLDLSSRAEEINVGFSIRSLTLGSFVWNRDNHRSMAALGDDGAVHLLQRSDLDTRPFSPDEAAALKLNAVRGINQPSRLGRITRAWQPTTKGGGHWSLTKQFATNVSSSVATPASQLMIAAQISPSEINDLLIIDQGNNKIKLVRPGDDRLLAQNSTDTQTQIGTISMNVEGTPTAVLAMPRKVNGERDLIVLRAGQAEPTSVVIRPQATITVDRVDDSHTSACTAAPNDCSLRGAVDFANANPGTTINVPDPTTIGGLSHIFSLALDTATGKPDNSGRELDFITSGTTMVGPGANLAIIRQTSFGRDINVNPANAANLTFAMSGLTVENGAAEDNFGGGLILLGGSANNYTITNCIFHEGLVFASAPNRAGGALSLLVGGNLQITGTTFIDNDSSFNYGGAVFFFPTADTPTTIALQQDTFTTNFASAEGGAVTARFNGGASPFNVSITDSTFNSNSVGADPAGISTVGGGAIDSGIGAGNVFSAQRNTFIANRNDDPAGFAGAIAISSGIHHFNFNRFVSNTTATPANGNTVNVTGGTADFTDNWWANIGGPKLNDIGPGAGTLTTLPALTLTVTPASASIPAGGSTAFTASFLTDTGNNPINVSNLTAFIGLPVNFSALGGNITGADQAIKATGTAGATFNATSIGARFAIATVDTAQASTIITVVAPPTISKSFGLAGISTGSSSSLTFTIRNNNSATTLTGIGFTDNLPAGLVVSTPNGLSGSCGGGTITAVVGSGSISLSGATIAANGQCSFSVNTTGTTGGTKNNVTSQVTSIEGGTGGTASASIDVLAPPVIAKAFGSSTIGLNATTSLTFTLTNPSANVVAETGVAFTDNLPAGIVVATPFTLTNTCGGSVSAGSGTISLSGGTIFSNSTCTVSVNVTATQPGQFTNVTGTVSSSNGGTGNSATANISVSSPPTISKSFAVGSMAVNQTTTLGFTITNPNTAIALTGVGFSDVLPAGLVVASPNGLTGSCGGGGITATAASPIITLNGGTIPANASCAFSVKVTATSAGTKNNVTTSVISNESGSGGTASASINIRPRSAAISVAFSANPVASGQTIQATATVVDTDAGIKLNPAGTISFSSAAGSDQFTPSTCNLSPVGASADTSSCQVNLSSTTVSTHSITANYDGSDLIHAAGAGAANLTVFVYGDLSGDGQVTIQDLVIEANIIAGNITPAAQQMLAGDVNQADGTGTITITDLVTLANFIAGNIKSLPVGQSSAFNPVDMNSKLSNRSWPSAPAFGFSSKRLDDCSVDPAVKKWLEVHFQGV
ncbi:MAG TPA: hypothetical protein VFC63_22680 [Blastocatellia bacterium]|nr:hypothetical protein [Blastocatellia bacterium]